LADPDYDLTGRENEMTEDEAKKKWCPHVRLTATDAEWNDNRPAENGRGLSMQCLGSDCMAWRWFSYDNDRRYIAACYSCVREQGINYVDAANYVDANRKKFGLPIKPFHGYCGLAGEVKI